MESTRSVNWSEESSVAFLSPPHKFVILSKALFSGAEGPALGNANSPRTVAGLAVVFAVALKEASKTRTGGAPEPVLSEVEGSRF